MITGCARASSSVSDTVGLLFALVAVGAYVIGFILCRRVK